MRSHMLYRSILFSTLIYLCFGISSPIRKYGNYDYSNELLENVVDLWWSVNETNQEITFELHIKTTGWIALGISPAGGMRGADIAVGWVDKQGYAHLQDRYAYGSWEPIMDNTTSNWFVLQGREENGWTAIQFKRLFDTCDQMDVAIKSGTNYLIYAYGLDDPDMSRPNGLIYYHENRRGSRMIPLRSYSNPPSEDKFRTSDFVDFKLDNQLVPAIESSYYCKVFKVPSNIREKRHAIARKTIVEPHNRDIVHHLGLLECHPSAVFDDKNLPDGVCDEIIESISSCFISVASIWAVGGDEVVEYPDFAGYPIGGDFEIKYLMLQMHYDNPKLHQNRHDSSGVRLYLGTELRQHELGYLSIGADVSYSAIVVPPGADKFIIDSYCSSEATKEFSEKAITILAACPHTHLQGRSVWTKLIRQGKAIDYVFNAESYDFNYQFENRLTKPIDLYPGDELATRCVYSSTDKMELTFGGERTRDEMCLHYLLYYPRMKTFHSCLSSNSEEAWRKMMNRSEPIIDDDDVRNWLKELKWTPQTIATWQQFFNNAPRSISIGGPDSIYLNKIPAYEDLIESNCKTNVFH